MAILLHFNRMCQTHEYNKWKRVNCPSPHFHFVSFAYPSSQIFLNQCRLINLHFFNIRFCESLSSFDRTHCIWPNFQIHRIHEFSFGLPFCYIATHFFFIEFFFQRKCWRQANSESDKQNEFRGLLDGMIRSRTP